MFCDTFYNRNIDFSIVDQLDMDHVYGLICLLQNDIKIEKLNLNVS